MKNKKTILLFGGGGFIGSHLVERLHQEYDITVFDKKYFSRKNIQPFENEIDIVEGDFQNCDDWLNLVQDADYIIHLAWSTLPASVNAAYDIQSNVLPTVKLLEVLKETGRAQLIFVSSGGTVYGKKARSPILEGEGNSPICSYGLTKLMVEKYLYLYNHLYDVDYRIARLSNPYGERQENIKTQGLISTSLVHLINSIPMVVWGDGTVIRDYIHIHDGVECIVKMLSYSGSERVFNVSSARGYSVNDIINAISLVTGKKMDILYENGRKCDIKENVLSNALAQKELNWQPKVELEDGILSLYNHLLKS